jgi:hypothetical protein
VDARDQRAAGVVQGALFDPVFGFHGLPVPNRFPWFGKGFVPLVMGK